MDSISSSKRRAGISSLSDELLINIFSFLTPKDLVSLSASNKSIAGLSNDPQLWKALFVEHFIKPRSRSKQRSRSSATNKPDDAALPTLSGLRKLLHPRRASTSTCPDKEFELTDEDEELEEQEKEETPSIFQEQQEWRPYQEATGTDLSTSLSNPDPDLDLGWSGSFPSAASSSSAVRMNASDSSSPKLSLNTSRSKKLGSASPAIVGLPSKFYQPHLRGRMSSNGFSSPRNPSSSSKSASASLVEDQALDRFSKELLNEMDSDFEEDDLRHEGLDWKALYIVSSNWKKGKFLVSELRNENSHGSEHQSHDEGDCKPREKLKMKEVDLEEHRDKSPALDHPAKPNSRPDSLPNRNQVSFKSRNASNSSWDSEAGPSRALTLVQGSHSSPLVFTASRIPIKLSDPRTINSDFPKIQIFHSESGREKRKDERNSGRTLNSSLGFMIPGPHTVERLTSWKKEARDEVKLSITEIRSDSIDRSQGLLAPVRQDQNREDSDSDLGREGGERLLVCYEGNSTMATTVFRIWVDEGSKIKYLEESSSFTHRNSSNSSDKVVASAMSSPILVTCSLDFKVKVYRIIPASSSSSSSTSTSFPSSSSSSSSSSTSELVLVQQMKSFSCEWPASFHLKSIPVVPERTNRKRQKTSMESSSNQLFHPEMVFRLSISFCTPSYPTSWSVSLQEILIHLPSLSSTSSSTSSSARITTRHATATNSFSYSPLDLKLKNRSSGINLDKGSISGSSWIFDERRLGTSSKQQKAMEEEEEEEAGSRSKILSVTYDSDWIVVGRKDNLLECYQVVGSTKSIQASPDRRIDISNNDSLTLNHRGVVYGHLGSVQSVALDDGRCVSGSSDGSVIVWSLLRREQAEEFDSALRSNRNSWERLKRTRLEKEGRSGSGLGKRKRWESEEKEKEKEKEKVILQDGDDDDDAPEISHVVTLRSSIGADPDPDPDYPDSSSASSDPSSKPSSGSTSLAAIPTLHDLLVQLREFKSRSSSRPNVIKWVGATFDKVLSVIQDCDHDQQYDSQVGRGLDVAGSSDRRGRRDEQVQIWSF